MTGSDPNEWTDFFVAAAGASAALAGLVFVAVSINIDRILALPGVPARALETVLTLLGVVLTSLVVLMPGLTNTALGLVLIAVVVVLIGLARQINAQGAAPEANQSTPSRLMMRTSAGIPIVIGGISLIADSGGGLYWVAAGLLLGTLAAVINAWVLLVEILR